MDRRSAATLHRRGSGAPSERQVASGTMESMLKRVMDEAPARRREFTIVHDGMEYQPAEIQNLAMQYVFNDNEKTERFRRRTVKASRGKA